jgi:hypothetical protein
MSADYFADILYYMFRRYIILMKKNCCQYKWIFGDDQQKYQEKIKYHTMQSEKNGLTKFNFRLYKKTTHSKNGRQQMVQQALDHYSTFLDHLLPPGRRRTIGLMKEFRIQ